MFDFFPFATIPKFFISSLIACNQNVAKMGTEIMVNIYRKRQQQTSKHKTRKKRQHENCFVCKQASSFRKAHYLWLMIPCVNFFAFLPCWFCFPHSLSCLFTSYSISTVRIHSFFGFFLSEIFLFFFFFS